MTISLKTTLITLILAAGNPVSGLEDVTVHPLKVKSYFDFGHVVSGFNSNAGEENQDVSMLPLNRGNVTVTQSAAFSESFDVSVGVTGLIWWPFSTENNQPVARVMRVKPMVPLARAKWLFGEEDGLNGYFQVGTFPYKYNPAAKNLGEYLYRSGTYPGFIFTTEGWLLMNRAGQYAHGAQLRLTHLDGALSHNFSLFMEMVYYPIGDFSPGYDFTYKMPFLELGGGVVFNHYLPIRPSLLESSENYIHVMADTTGQARWQEYEGPENSAFSPYAAVNDEIIKPDTLDTYTHKGIKLMGRVTLNLNSLLPDGRKSPQDLQLFVEAAILGVKNYPFYYDKRAERIPLMFGVNIPTFGLLDLLCFQAEYYSSPFNDFSKLNQESSPIWNIDTKLANGYKDSLWASNNPATTGALNKWWEKAANSDDDFKWSIYAKKKLNNLATLYLQAASDHFRLIDEAMLTSAQPVTSSPKEWYYLLRLELSI